VGFVVVGNVKTYEVGLLAKLVQGDLLCSVQGFLFNEGIVEHNVHFEGLCPFRNFPGNSAEAYEAQCSVPEFKALAVVFLVPLALLHGSVGNWNVSAAGKHVPKCQFSNGNRACAWGVPYGNTPCFCFVNIDVVETNAAPDNQLKGVFAVFKYGDSYLGSTSHNHDIVSGYGFQKSVLVHSGFYGNLVSAIFNSLDG